MNRDILFATGLTYDVHERTTSVGNLLLLVTLCAWNHQESASDIRRPKTARTVHWTCIDHVVDLISSPDESASIELLFVAKFYS